jgi:hypothetical protein
MGLSLLITAGIVISGFAATWLGVELIFYPPQTPDARKKVRVALALSFVLLLGSSLWATARGEKAMADLPRQIAAYLKASNPKRAIPPTGPSPDATANDSAASQPVTVQQHTSVQVVQDATPPPQPLNMPSPGLPEHAPINKSHSTKTPSQPTVPIKQHGAGSGAVGGNITTTPCSAVAVGGINTQQTVNCEAPSHWYDLNGTERSKVGNNFNAMVGDQLNAYEDMKNLRSANKWTELRDVAEKQITLTPEWPTPYLEASFAYARLCQKDSAMKDLQEFIDKATVFSRSTSTYDQPLQVARSNLAALRAGHGPAACN